MRTLKRACRGFTLAELVVVMVVVGVLAVVAIPRFGGASEYAARGATDFVGAALRHAQKSAIAMRRNVCVGIGTTALDVTYASAAGSSQACAAGNTLVNPANNLPYSDASNTLPGGATVASASSVVFDALGRPLSAPGTALAAALAITVNGYATPVTIEPETGAVH